MLVGTLMSEAIRITSEGQFQVNVDYAGHVDSVYLHAHRASCDSGWAQDKHQRFIWEHRRLSPYDPDDPERAARHWEQTLATLNNWHDRLNQLKQPTAA